MKPSKNTIEESSSEQSEAYQELELCCQTAADSSVIYNYIQQLEHTIRELQYELQELRKHSE